MSLDTRTRAEDWPGYAESSFPPAGAPSGGGPHPMSGPLPAPPYPPHPVTGPQSVTGPQPVGGTPSLGGVHPAGGAHPITGPLTGGMAAPTTAGAFGVLDTSIRLTDADHATIKGRRDHVENVLRSLFRPQSSLPLVGVATIGSAGRDTMIRPLDEVDVFAVFSAATGAWKRFRFDATGLLTAVREALGGDSVEIIGSRGKAVRLVYDAAPDVHLIPAFDHPRAGYVMADGVGGWLPTRPERHAQWMGGFDDAVPATVRLLKYWNRVYGSHLRSFHLEALTGATIGGRGLTTRQALNEVFVTAGHSLEAYDPAGIGGDLSSYLTGDDLAAVRDALAFAAGHSGQAVAAEAAGDHEEAISMWRVVFGPALPAFG